MTETNSTGSYSNDHLYYETLVSVFMVLNVVDLAIVSVVCKTWNRASRDPTLRHKLDLSKLSSRGFNLPMKLHGWMDRPSSRKFTQLLKYTLNSSYGNTNCLIFNYFVYLMDVHLVTAAERTPNLKRLVLPLKGNLTKNGIYNAMELWKSLESITITQMVSEDDYIFCAIGKYGLNITELKFTSIFEQDAAEALIKYTPNLKILSIRYIVVNMRALCRVLNELKSLEKVNVCHSFIMDKPNEVISYSTSDLRHHLHMSNLIKLIICKRRMCLRCKYQRRNDPNRPGLGFMEDIWREDEIPSLAH